MSGIPGLRGSGNWGTDERPKDFRESILFFNPAGDAPIFALTGRAGKKTVTDPEFNWWAESMNIIRLQTNLGATLAAGDTTITVNSPDPTASTPGVVYGTATHLKPGDVLLVEPSADNATFNHELIEVESVLSDTQFTARRGVGGTSASTIANDVYLTKIGSAYAEGTSAPTATSRNPIKYNNYTQIFKDSYELTGTADATEARTGSAWSNDKKRKMFDHSRDIEWSMLFGRKAETTGSNGKPKRFMGGMREFVPATNVTVFGAAVTMNSFMDALEPMFDFSMPGSGTTRAVFMGNHALIELNKVIAGTTNIDFNYDGQVDVYGLKFHRYIMPFGEVLLKSHPLLSRHGLYKASAFVLDFNAIKYTCLKGRDTKVKDDIQADDEDVRRGYIQTECSLMVDGGGLTCGYLGNIAST